MPDFSPTQYAVPAFVLLVLVELVWAWRKSASSYEARDTSVSLMMGLGSTIAGAATGGLVIAAMLFCYQYRLFDFGPQWWAVWWAWPLCFVLDDLAYYWVHRAGHRIRWFWASHVNHHTSQHYNLSTALRQSWTGAFTLGFAFKLPLVLLGFHPAMIAIVYGFNLIYQFWIHTEAIKRMPRWFEAVMNTPSHHRVHHATNPLYLDRNYAGVFIVWDRLFDTFEAEDDTIPIRYGTVKQLGSFNLLWAVFHEWIGMVRDAWNAPWGHKLSYLWREPGWRHDGPYDNSAALRAKWLARRNRQPQSVPKRNPIAGRTDAA